MNQFITVGAILLGIGAAVFLVNIVYSSAKGKPANMDDPWGLGGKYFYPYEAKNPHHSH